MSYQERIYSQNGKCNRNFVGPVPTLSSDICVFNRPAFIMSGASSIDCPEATCDISSTPYNDLFTGATNCFTFNELSGSCFNSIEWTTNVYEDDVLVYSNAFYSSNSLTGPVIGETEFSGSVVTAFDTLEYDYSFSGTEFTISREDNTFNNIKLELTTELDYDLNCQVTGNTTGDTSCSCPVGYTATTGNDDCQKLTYVAATLNDGGLEAVANGVPNPAYGATGTLFYPKINGMSFPLTRSGSTVNLKQFSGAGVAYDIQVLSDFWGYWDTGVSTHGRLNKVGVRKTNPDLTEWVGFASCIDIPTSGTYYIGIAADNRCRFKLDTETIFTLEIDDVYNHKVWHMLPIDLTSGIHIIEMEGRNDDNGTATSFGAEIYSASLEDLTGSTTTGTTGLIFSTFDERNGTFDLGEDFAITGTGYSCPVTYAFDACWDGSARCVLIENEPITCLFTGDCATNEATICDLDFSGLTINSTNVYVLTGDTETFDLSFEFTANTESFDTTNASFKYEIYKYLPVLGYFNSVPNYTSEYSDWSSISGTSAFTTSVTASTIDPDGEYLVKGQYIHDVCTEFATLLDKKVSTASLTRTDNYGIYQPTRDFYFVAFNEADEPELNTNNDNPQNIGNLIINSTILDGTENEFNFPYVDGDYIISLNGLTLSPDYDYSVGTIQLTDSVAITVSLIGDTISGDVLTYAYASGGGDNSVSTDSFDINTPIVSGPTDSEGSNTVYFNTTTGKYEIYLSMAPINGSSIGISLNGVTLANNIDYYQSISNPKRIIFEGTLILNDMLVAYYTPSTTVTGDQYGTSITVGWTIENPPNSTNGLFTVEISNDTNFTTIVSSATTQHIIGVVGYTSIVNLVGNLGDKQYYRVKNEKNFVTLCNETLTTSAYSEFANIIIQSNVNNSY